MVEGEGQAADRSEPGAVRGMAAGGYPRGEAEGVRTRLVSIKLGK